MFNSFYRNKGVLVTGHTGFKGGWLSLWLKELGAVVCGISLPPPTQPNLYDVVCSHAFTKEIECDIRNQEDFAAAVAELQPEVVFHLAAQPIVRHSYERPLETFETNALGTANLLESIRRAKLHCPVIVVTSDKCYENREWEFAYRENDPLGGHDVYSMSKAATELVAQAWNRSFFRTDDQLGLVATVRAGNVIGGGDYAEDRIVPDCIRALREGKAVLVRNPVAVRPWQHVLECLSGYLWLAARLAQGPTTSPLASAFNFGPDAASRQTVRELVEEILKVWPGEWVDGSQPDAPHEARLLSLAIEKANTLLGWRPCWDFETAVRQTMAWYRRRHLDRTDQMVEFSVGQIEEYVRSAESKGLSWAIS